MKELLACLFICLLVCCKQSTRDSAVLASEEKFVHLEDSLFSTSSDIYLTLKIYKNAQTYEVVFLDSLDKNIYLTSFKTDQELQNVIYTCYNNFGSSKELLYILRNEKDVFYKGWSEKNIVLKKY